MMIVYWLHIDNCLAYMASLAKKILLIKCSQSVAINCGSESICKNIYVKKIILSFFLQKW